MNVDGEVGCVAEGGETPVRRVLLPAMVLRRRSRRTRERERADNKKTVMGYP